MGLGGTGHGCRPGSGRAGERQCPSEHGSVPGGVQPGGEQAGGGRAGLLACWVGAGRAVRLGPASVTAGGVPGGHG